MNVAKHVKRILNNIGKSLKHSPDFIILEAKEGLLNLLLDKK